LRHVVAREDLQHSQLRLHRVEARAAAAAAGVGVHREKWATDD
jgi:hypothetical protein